MIPTLLRRHLYHQRVLIGSLVVCMLLFEVLIIHIGSAMDRGPGFTEILETLPKFLRDLLRTQIGELSFPTFAAFGFEHPATMGSALAYVIFVATIPAGERDSGLADLLLARPVERRQYLGATILHLHLTALVLPTCLLIGTALGTWMVDNDKALPWTSYLPGAIGLWTLLQCWGGIALLVATGPRRRGAAVVQLVAAVLITFLLHVLGQFASVLDWIVWISPFHYFNPIGATMLDRPWQWTSVLLAAVGVCTMALALRRFHHRDL